MQFTSRRFRLRSSDRVPARPFTCQSAMFTCLPRYLRMRCAEKRQQKEVQFEHSISRYASSVRSHVCKHVQSMFYSMLILKQRPLSTGPWDCLQWQRKPWNAVEFQPNGSGDVRIESSFGQGDLFFSKGLILISKSVFKKGRTNGPNSQTK